MRSVISVGHLLVVTTVTSCASSFELLHPVTIAMSTILKYTDLNIESKVHNVAVTYDVLLAFDRQLSSFLNGSFRAER